MFDHLKPADGYLSRRARIRRKKESFRRAQVQNDVLMALNLAQNTTRGPSGAIWYDCPWNQYKANMADGMAFEDDFLVSGNAVMSSAYRGSIGQWSVYGYAGATLADGAAEGGILTFGSDGDVEGVALQSATGSFRIAKDVSTLTQQLWFEARVARSSITTATEDCFVGLMTPSLSSGLPAAAQPISNHDTLSTTPSLIGFHSTGSTGTRGGPTEWAFSFGLASGTVNYPTNLTTLIASSGATAATAGGFIKLGFVFDPNALAGAVSSATARQTAGAVKKKLIRIFVNGLELPTFLSSDDVLNQTSGQAFPTGFMCPVIANLNDTGSTPPTMSVDWIRIAQRGNS